MRHLASPYFVVLFAACTQAGAANMQLELVPGPQRLASARHKLTVDSLLETLTLREKVGQLLVPWLSGSYVATEADAFDTVTAWVEEYGVGGVVISIGSPLDTVWITIGLSPPRSPQQPVEAV